MQVTKITTQQGRPQIRILVTCGQVVNAYQNDREQDEDLTQKDYFLFRTHGTEHMPRSSRTNDRQSIETISRIAIVV